MSNGVIVAIVIAVLVLLVGGVIAYFIARRLRGTIKITMSKKGFDPGDKVTGSFELITRKDIEGKRLFAALVGKEVTRERYRDSRDQQQTRTNTREIYRDEQTIEDAKNYPAGQTTTYEFELQAPSNFEEEGFMDSSLVKTLKLGMELVGGRQTHLEWRVNVRLDAEGIDLGDSESVTINLPL